MAAKHRHAGKFTVRLPDHHKFECVDSDGISIELICSSCLAVMSINLENKLVMFYGGIVADVNCSKKPLD